MDLETIHQVAWVGDAFGRGEIRGVVLVFHGLGQGSMKREPNVVEYAWAEAGALVVYPYYGPWSWMNRQARVFVDELLDAVYRQFGLTNRVPLISTGGSMGGHSALLYARYAKRPVAGVLADFPACDLAYHFDERPDLPRTIYHAFRGYEEPLERLLVEHSPLAQAQSGAMPHVPYLIIQGDADRLVSKAHHADQMVAALEKHRHNVDYMVVPGMGHGGPTPKYVTERRIAFVTDLMRRG